MDKRELQKLLSQPYKQENWKEIIQFVFPNVSILSSPKEFPIHNDKIKKFRQIGSVRLNDGKNLALFELLLADSVNIQRNRVELNNEISKYIDQEQIHGVLSVFEQGTDDYRFTFSARSTEFDEEESDFVQKKTDTKRYTYVLGKNESCKTPADRFYKLSENKSDVDINAIQHAFSVEQLSKEFFDKYKKQFDKFWTYISKTDELRNVFHADDKEKQELKIRNFTKKLLGRIVFLHFLQKKGWMGCPDKNSWGSGDKQFMQNLFKGYSNKGEFHSKCLVQLFYNTLNAKRDDNLFTSDGLDGALNNSKVPYLNGGLFDSDKKESKKIDFPEQYFEDLFEFFGQYNFTIDENDPNDHEVGIDPEMLGHIFENLLEDNKDKGAFYTPKVIVQYMCQESLIEYLATKLNAESSSEVKGAIEDLVRNRLAEKSSDLDIVEPIAQALYDVKVCDPAIGSGAFPMGILNVIYQVIEELYWIQPDSVSRVWNISDTEWQPHLVKKNIIQHSIYGVDIESGAVDIARLRFWLALVVDEVEPLPLPNLDYKIMQGNSLLESFEGIDLSQISDASAYDAVYESEQIDMFTGEAKKKVTMSLNFEDIKALMDEYFNADDADTKKDLHKRIDEQVLNHIHFTLSEHKNELKKIANKVEKKLRLDEAAALTWEQKEKIRTNSKGAKELIKLNKELAKQEEKENKLAQLSNSNERPFFLWHLFFQEVFDQGGFDIVIGNPPYIGERKNKTVFIEVQNGNNGKYYFGRMDYFYFFFHLGIDLLTNSGNLTFITTNYFPTAMGARKLRNDLKKRTSILNIINFNEGKVFDSAYGQHNMITHLKNEQKNNVCHSTIVSISGFLNEHKLMDILYNRSSNELKYFSENFQNNLWDGDENYLRIEGVSSNDKSTHSSINSILDKIVSKSNDFLGKACKPLIGLESSLDSVYVVSKNKIDKIIEDESERKHFVPFFKNSDISKYETKLNTDRFILYLHEKIENIESVSGVWKYLKDNENGIKNRKGANLRGAFKRGNWWVLNTPRLDMDFGSEKIVTPYRTKKLKFALSKSEWYASRDVYYIIKNKSNIELRFILGLLNSTLYYNWFFYRGKRKGDTLELYAKPLKETPLYIPSNSKQLKIIGLVNKILKLKEKGEETFDLEQQIDNLVYKIYELTYDEVLIIEPEFSERMSKEKYEALEVI